jgi:hypothetical protein
VGEGVTIQGWGDENLKSGEQEASHYHSVK